MPKSKLRKKKNKVTKKSLSSDQKEILENLALLHKKIEKEQLPFALDENNIKDDSAKISCENTNNKEINEFGKNYSYEGIVIFKVRCYPMKNNSLFVSFNYVVNGTDQEIAGNEIPLFFSNPKLVKKMLELI